MQEVMKKEELLEEVKVVLQDEFVAEIKEENGTLVMRFVNGQSFRLTLDEV